MLILNKYPPEAYGNLKTLCDVLKVSYSTYSKKQFPFKIGDVEVFKVVVKRAERKELNEMRNGLLKATRQAQWERETAALTICDIDGCWVISNNERPTEDGVYTTIDSRGIECETLFDNKHWIIRPGGHPVQLWLNPNCR